MFVVSFERLLKGPTESAFGKFHIYWVREYFGGFFFLVNEYFGGL